MRRFWSGLLLGAVVVVTAGCPKKQGKAVPAEVEIDWPDAAPQQGARDAGPLP